MGTIAEEDRRYSREEYLRWRESQPAGQFERIDGRIVPTAPDRGAHLRMKAAIWLTLREAFFDKFLMCL